MRIRIIIIFTLVVVSLVFAYFFVVVKKNQPKTQENERIENRVSFNNGIFREVEDFLNSLFKKSVQQEIPISLTFTGDVILARSVNFLTVKSNDFTWSFRNIAEELKNSDLTIINLESPLIKNCPLTNEGFKFCGDERNVQGLVFSGIDVVGLANNHAGNYGDAGVKETISNLEKNNISVSGATERKIAYKEVRGTKFAFLSLNTIGYVENSLVWGSEENLKNLIIEARKNADVVIVQLHWGVEYVEDPTENQKNLGRLAIDLGADMVVGNHPHWIQKYEVYKDKYILYALGNFVFDQEWSQKTKEGVIAKVSVKDKKIYDLQFIPVEIRNYGQVYKTQNITIFPKLMRE